MAYELNNSIFLIGSSEYGPVNTPIKIDNFNELTSIFGNRGSLIESASVLFSTNPVANVTVVKSTGSHAEAYFDINDSTGEIITDALYVKSKHANEKGNKISIIIKEDKISVVFIHGKESYEATYPTDDITLYELCERINKDTRELKNDVFFYCSCSPNTAAKTALIGLNDERTLLEGGCSGLFYTKNMIYHALEDTYSILKGIGASIVIPTDVNFDDTFTDNADDLKLHYDLNRDYLTLKDDSGEYLSFHKQLLDFLLEQMSQNVISFGVMGLHNTNKFCIDGTITSYCKYFKSVNKLTSDYDKYTHLISVCVGDLYHFFGTRVFNSKLAYATVMASLTIATNTTNKEVGGNLTLYNSIDTKVMEELAQLGFCTFRYSKLKKSLVVYSGVTLSDEENFKYYSSVRAMQIVLNELNKKLKVFIGCNIFDLIKLKKIDNVLTSTLEKLSELKYIKGYSVKPIKNPYSGTVTIDIALRTIDMVEEINIKGALGEDE